MPSDYVKRNCWFGATVTQVDVDGLDTIGLDRIMWGADFPHHEGTAPTDRIGFTPEQITNPLGQDEVPDDPNFRMMFMSHTARIGGAA
jgi:hypothetical protein